MHWNDSLGNDEPTVTNNYDINELIDHDLHHIETSWICWKHVRHVYFL